MCSLEQSRKQEGLVNMLIKRKINDVDFEVNIEKGDSILCSREISNVIKGDLNSFIEYLYEKKGSYIPLAVTLEITNICNFRCQFCYINEENKKNNILEFCKLKKGIDYLVDRGLLVVYLTGGEILSHPEFEEIYRYLKKKGIFVVLLTNLSLLNEKYLQLFKDLPPYRITVSIYGASNEQFKNVTRIDYDFKKVLENILLLKENGITVTCQTPLNKLTLPDFDLIKNWCNENNIKYSHSTELSDTYSGKSLNYLKIENEINETYKREFITKSKINFGYRYHFDCRAGKHTFVISSDYKLRPCFMLFGKNERTFDANDSIEIAMTNMIDYINDMRKKKIDGCNGCIAHNICSECLFSQQKVCDLDEYMNKKCKMNLERLKNLKVID